MTTALQIHTPPQPQSVARPGGALLRPIAEPHEVLEAQNALRELTTKALTKGRDYGEIPGTDKPTLLKPGAERVTLAMGCYYGEPEIVEKEVDHDREVKWVKRRKKWRNQFQGDREFTWEEERGVSFGLYRYVVRRPVVHRESGQVVGYGIGACSTMESKYVQNPRDAENTALKMADKRAIVGGALVTFGLSDQFTQDVEDAPEAGTTAAAAPAAQAPAAATSSASATSAPAAASAPQGDAPPCPKCRGAMWDNRVGKKNPKAPDFKCKDRSCEGVIWPPKKAASTAPAAAPAKSHGDDLTDEEWAALTEEEELPLGTGAAAAAGKGRNNDALRNG